ncbi:16S rRNA (guanine(966)-N(2))-methyltransferase RsmD [Campylobacter helveticus]|uniref:16S rRNA (Guanine(966)-N(2))-methyltransferase RsmD n=1 Tax=Campylobacter helveticus TaxID=28898 RepID=A0AAX2UN46_9BACT|nr:16S rRNA (guanine(966)-N(2))-methyltransferase RsmD [Campylobacter helveticus]ARE81244.1 RNA methyltransferase, RsmD family [Campylobacter helveticus]MCR2040069.1 16S rRNA (guanine(966)-N(2))-methyltransferase RsmD [Campylobacter helveticus]MCR2055476.1 16S rRNA (guanine(966)-N(2))-methyltransferase RsmD [Campylobacter helveticus]MCR2056891.1 16S rRNA (guanine(966)-N(2))-methyltransferase RsmD [Campylobacter helveticus]MCR2060929.1 16S rRNA (guanine(966)-N(2))-methyltransferase RsmD [Campyl
MNESFPSVKEFLKNYKNSTPKKSLKLYTTIESGKFKGKKFLLPSLDKTRSTKSIVRACVFNVLREHLRGRIFIEAFGGSALMAAEALSNYALKAYAIELDRNAFKIASQNAKSLNAELEILNADTFLLLPELLKRLNEPTILYFDPPFDVRQGFEGIYNKIFHFLTRLDLSLVERIIFEHQSKAKTPENIANFTRVKLKKFGATSLSFYEILT